MKREKDDSSELVKKFSAIVTAAEAAKRAPQTEVVNDIASLKEVAVALDRRISKLERPFLKQKPPKGRVKKAMKKKRQHRAKRK